MTVHEINVKVEAEFYDKDVTVYTAGLSYKGKCVNVGVIGVTLERGFSTRTFIPYVNIRQIDYLPTPEDKVV